MYLIVRKEKKNYKFANNRFFLSLRISLFHYYFYFPIVFANCKLINHNEEKK